MGQIRLYHRIEPFLQGVIMKTCCLPARNQGFESLIKIPMLVQWSDRSNLILVSRGELTITALVGVKQPYDALDRCTITTFYRLGNPHVPRFLILYPLFRNPYIVPCLIQEYFLVLCYFIYPYVLNGISYFT